ncbi:aspartokinase 1, chloroplastic-like isoform X2 [Triticum urartu]|uniref:aspartokinase 1, chloroplastic-like isoform X2 n=1 Tax=Triticum urartu TaxID=4572 RepID=UPI0020442201|nr:aspartokinase 1, chloroplastic-like isoform X2 [Triticum urartu]
MIEIGLDHHHHLVLCKVYRSPRSTADPAESCTTTAGAEDVGPAPAGTGLSGVEDGLHDSTLQGVAGGGMPCPPEPAPGSYDYNLHSLGLARKPALLIGPASKHRTLAIVNKSNATASVEATILMKFGGSSIPSAERMKEMAKLVLVSQNPVVVLSAMGNTNTNIRLAAWKALRCGARKASEIDELAIIKALHLRTIDELGLDRSTVSGPLDELEQHLQYVAMTKELTPSTKDYLVSFGERASTKMFSGYLNKLGKQEWELCSITNFGRSGGDLTTTTTGRSLGLREIQVWRDVDSMFTCDPNVCGNAIHIPYLTFDEGVELRCISEQSMQIAVEGGIKVTVKNSYNPQARGTVITKTRDMSKSILTSIALKSNITILDIERTSTLDLDQNAFVEKAISIFQNFEYLSISVDWIATSEGKVSFTLVPSKLLSRELIQPALDMSVQELQTIADVHRLHDMSVISLIGKPGRSIDILGKVLSILQSRDVAVEKVSQGVSKVISTY